MNPIPTGWMFKLLETYLFRILVLSKIEYTAITSISIACCNSFLTCPKNRKHSLTVHRYAPAPTDTRSSSTASTWAVSHQNHHEIFSEQKHSAGSPHYNTLYIMGFPLLSLQKTSMAIPTLSNGFVMLLLSMGLFRCARHPMCASLHHKYRLFTGGPSSGSHRPKPRSVPCRPVVAQQGKVFPALSCREVALL